MTSNRLVLETPRGWKSIRRLLPFPESAPISREMFAIRPATCLPSNGRREKRNWHLRSPAGTPSRSVRATNLRDSAEPTRGERPNLRQVRFELRHHDSQQIGIVGYEWPFHDRLYRTQADSAALRTSPRAAIERW